MEGWHLLPAPAEDRQYLTDHPHRSKILSIAARLKEEPYLGEPLKPLQAHQVHRGDMTHCRVVKVAGMEYEDEIRIVYKLNEERKEVQIVAIGPRMRSEVYQKAMAREYPRVDPPRWALLSRRRQQNGRIDGTARRARP